MKKILVAFSSKTGSTAEVADAIGKVLAERGLAVDVLRITEVRGLDPYSAAVLGSPINGMRWQPEAAAFVTANAAALRAMPVALFYLSYIEFADGRPLWKRSIKKGMDALATSVNALVVRGFGGRIEAAFPAFPRFLFGTRADASTDLRDWDAIRAWAAELAPRL